MNLFESQKEKEWRSTVKKVVVSPKLIQLKKECATLRFIKMTSFISSVSGFISIDSIEKQYKTPVGILSGIILSIGISSGVLLVQNKKIMKPLKFQSKQEYKKIISETKNLDIIEKQKILEKKYKIIPNDN